MASEAQRKASKKYLKSKKRIYVTFNPEQIKEIESVLKLYGYYDSLPEFIRDACKYYVEELRNELSN